jgi:hypothetical protein
MWIASFGFRGFTTMVVFGGGRGLGLKTSFLSSIQRACRVSYSSKTTTYKAEHLRDFTTRVFEKLGVPKEDAILASDVLSRSDLRGIDSHGVGLEAFFIQIFIHQTGYQQRD